MKAQTPSELSLMFVYLVDKGWQMRIVYIREDYWMVKSFFPMKHNFS